MIEPAELTLRHLDIAVAVARQGGISAASTEVNLSQPALTQALAKLERKLGHPLFTRQSTGTTSTKAGHFFIARAERALDLLAEGVRQLRRSARLAPIAHIARLVTMPQLQALNAVERTGSYVMAGRDLSLSQPSVHRAVKELEQILGFELLARVGRHVRPTMRAVRLVRAIRLMSSELQAGLDELAAIDRAGAGRVVIGALPLPRAGLLPEALGRFARTHGAAEVRIVEGPYIELLSALRGGDIDLMVGALRDPAPTADIVQTSLFSDDLYIVARADHPLVGPDTPPPDALAAYPWIVGAPGAPMRSTWEILFADGQPELRMDCGSILTARGLLLEGDWLALMSPDQFRIEQRCGLLATVGGPIAGSRRRIGFTVRSGWQPTATQNGLLSELRAAGERRTSGI
jgi:LysR family transcriptional regulator, regulator for genes of the gallate degradation pathway